MKRIRKFLKLSHREQWLLIQATIVLAAVVLGLRTLPWLTLKNQLLKLANRYSQFAPRPRPSAQQIVRVIKVASLFIPTATCLPKALAAQFLLIRNAYPADLQIGVARTEAGNLEAHAWVTSEGVIIMGGVDDINHFVPLAHMKREDTVDYVRAP